MKCDKCDKEATVHEVMIRAGKRSERHLCEQHAREEGVAPPSAPSVPIVQILPKYITGPGLLSDAPLASAGAGGASSEGAKGAPGKVTQCPNCGLGFAQFRQVGLLGCPDCYAAFESQLTPLLARAHEGGTHHVGRGPAEIISHSGASSSDEAERRAIAARRARVDGLRLRLAEAVEQEQYERAAAIRDEISGLSAPVPSTQPKPVARRVKKDKERDKDRDTEPRTRQEPGA